MLSNSGVDTVSTLHPTGCVCPPPVRIVHAPSHEFPDMLQVLTEIRSYGTMMPPGRMIVGLYHVGKLHTQLAWLGDVVVLLGTARQLDAKKIVIKVLQNALFINKIYHNGYRIF